MDDFVSHNSDSRANSAGALIRRQENSRSCLQGESLKGLTIRIRRCGPGHVPHLRRYEGIHLFTSESQAGARLKRGATKAVTFDEEFLYFFLWAFNRNMTMRFTKPKGIALSSGNLRLPLGPAYGDTSFLKAAGAGGKSAM